ncbi:MAG: hypothetical protein DRH17_00970 [Deltaproteobacteria bacterium]|nr:MAG: hypothetical protein DRH17_00970 [Deltaproteobacteria bacterium]
MIIRIDDYPHGDLIIYNRLLADRSYDHRRHVYHFLRPFEERGVSYVLGVSPGLINRESDLFFLRSLHHCEVAMHGFSHGWHEFAETWHSITETWPYGGEFAHASREEVREKIQRGLEILSDFKIRKFIAPFNAYTQELLDVLNEFGFEMIMGGRQTLQFGMDRLDHGNLQLDVCVPPLCNDSHKIIPHLDQAIVEQKTILLHWIFEQAANVSYWDQIAEAVQHAESHRVVSPKHAEPYLARSPVEVRNVHTPIRRPSSALATGKELLHSLPIAIVTETMNYISGGVRCIAEVLNRLAARGYQTACYVTLSDLRCEWLTTDFPILPVSELLNFRGILISPFSPTAEIVARSNAIGKFYWVHSYEPKFPEITGRPDSWRVMSENSYRLPELQYFTTSSYVRMILELIYGLEVLSPLVPGGVDISLFRPGPKGNRPLRVLFLSRENPFRGAHDVVHALRIVRDQGVDLDVYVMGQAINMEGLPHRLVPPLPQSEFAQLLGSADIFIHASHFEGLPLPPLEAMAAKCAVIATYVGASDYLLNGYNALVVPPKRPDKIAEALLCLATDADLRARFGEGGYRTVTNNYTWEHTVDRLEEALSEGMARIGYGSMATTAWMSSHEPKPSTSTHFHVSELEKSRDPHKPGEAPFGEGDVEDDWEYLVSAIVSTYNAERFIRGCLEDLEAQTISDRLEIIVVNSGSEQNEEMIVKEFQEKYPNIKYIRTPQRETVYAAWNRGIKASRGKYITNANTDDRHRPDAYERMVGVLEARPDIALVYADVIITEKENETFEKCTPIGICGWIDWDRRRLLEGRCFMGPQPMWRRSLHDEYGYFDESFVTSGDYEFWLRVSQTNNFFHIPTPLGLYLKSSDSIEHLNRKQQQEENEKIVAMYKKAEASGDIIRRFYSDNEEDLIRVHNRKGEELFKTGNVKVAKVIFEQILSKNPKMVDPLNNLGVIAFQQGEIDRAISYFTRVIEIDEDCFEAIENLGKCMEIKRDYLKAIKWFKRALEIKPDEVSLLNALGNCFVQIEDLMNAKDVYTKSFHLDSSQDTIRTILEEMERIGKEKKDLAKEYE